MLWGYVKDWRDHIIRKQCNIIASSLDGVEIYGETLSDPVTGYFNFKIGVARGTSVLLSCYYEGIYRGQLNLAGSHIVTTDSSSSSSSLSSSSSSFSFSSSSSRSSSSSSYSLSSSSKSSSSSSSNSSSSSSSSLSLSSSSSSFSTSISSSSSSSFSISSSSSSSLSESFSSSSKSSSSKSSSSKSSSSSDSSSSSSLSSSSSSSLSNSSSSVSISSSSRSISSFSKSSSSKSSSSYSVSSSSSSNSSSSSSLSFSLSSSSSSSFSTSSSSKSNSSESSSFSSSSSRSSSSSSYSISSSSESFSSSSSSSSSRSVSSSSKSNSSSSSSSSNSSSSSSIESVSSSSRSSSSVSSSSSSNTPQSVSVYTESESDAGWTYNVGGGIFTTNLIVGNWDITQELTGYIRYNRVPILPGSTILSAKLFMTGYNTNSWTVSLKFCFENSANPARPSDKDDLLSREYVSNQVSWSQVGITKDLEYEITGLEDAIQEIISLDDWDALQSMMIIIPNNGSSPSSIAQFYTRSGGAAKSPRLEIEWHDPSGHFRTAVYPTSGLDDGEMRASALVNDRDYLTIGQEGGQEGDIYVRFNNVNVSPPVAIKLAYVTFRSYSQTSGDKTTETKVYFNFTVNAAAPLTYGEYYNLSKTDYVIWQSGDWMSGGKYFTSQLKNILQTIFNLSGWIANNSVQVLVQDNLGTNICTTASSYDHGFPAELEIVYESLSSSSSSYASISISNSSSSSYSQLPTSPEVSFLQTQVEAIGEEEGVVNPSVNSLLMQIESIGEEGEVDPFVDSLLVQVEALGEEGTGVPTVDSLLVQVEAI